MEFLIFWLIGVALIIKVIFELLKDSAKEDNIKDSQSKEIVKKPIVKTTLEKLKDPNHTFINGHSVIFKPETHKYIVDGKVVPSVSEIIERFAGILNINNDYAGVSKTVLSRAAAKGSWLHYEIESHEKYNAISDSIEFRNYLKIKKELEFEVKETEKIILLYNKKGKVVGAGRLDLVVDLKGKLTILDIKRTYKFYREKVTAQVNLYKIGYHQTYKEKIHQIYCLRLRNFDMEMFKLKSNTKKMTEILEYLV